MTETVHARCRRPACEFHVVDVLGAIEVVAERHRQRTGHTVDEIPESDLEFEPASSYSDEPVGDDENVGRA